MIFPNTIIDIFIFTVNKSSSQANISTSVFIITQPDMDIIKRLYTIDIILACQKLFGYPKLEIQVTTTIQL